LPGSSPALAKDASGGKAVLRAGGSVASGFARRFGDPAPSATVA